MPSASHRSLFVLAFVLIASTASAQNTRSAVSVTGSDSAMCTVLDPCRTFNIALAHTNADGEVIALTSGGYGPFTVDRPASISAAPGIYAALVAPGGNGVVINAGPGAKVVLRNLFIYGMLSGYAGVSVTGSGAETSIENCVIDGFHNFGGVVASLNFNLANSTIRNCNSGLWITNATTPVKAYIERVLIEDTFSAYAMFVGANARVTVLDSASYRSGGEGFHAEAGGNLTLENTISVGASSGFRVQGTGSKINISNCVATDNGTGLVIVAPGVMETAGNNKVSGNSTNVAGTPTGVGQQ